VANETILVISGDGMPPYAVRGITESLVPIDAVQFEKYRLTLSCEDVDSPAFDAVRVGNWRRTVGGGLYDLSGNGSTLTVDCITELSYKTPTGSPPSYTASRTVVPGSERTANGFTFYRPRLTVGVIGKSQETDEYGARRSWELECEEI
jgi:hypothetical protein